MSDILERLRVQARSGLMFLPHDFKAVSYGEAADEITRLRAALSEAEQKSARSEAEKVGLLQALQHHTGCDHGIMAIRMLVDRAVEAEQRARREALEAAAKTIEEGFDRGIVSKHDLCAHKKFEWEDCESCAATAIRALISSEPHDAEGRE